jgi:ferredoxin-NADP reductase
VRSLQVAKKTKIADDIVELVLVDPAGTDLPSWEPGAHVVLNLPGGLRRQYSLCGTDPTSGRWTIAVHRSPGSRGGSTFVHDGLEPGSVVEVDGPINNFPLEQRDRMVFIAGGIGVTPIIAMIRALRSDPNADFEFLYCGRQTSLMAYRDEIEAWQDPRVRIHSDRDAGGPPDLSAVLARREDALVYCCGPEPMIEAVENLAADRSLVRVERFRAADDEHAVNAAFDVVIADSGERYRVEAEDSILETLERAGYDLPNDCREGICGTCETVVVKGTPEHRDSVLTEDERAENTVMMICCSRSAGDELVLELAEW